MPIRHSPDDPSLANILTLIQDGFAYMDSLIDPPCSVHRLTLEAISAQCARGEFWSIGDPPFGCIFLKYKNDALYLGKICVSEVARGKGTARRLVQIAEDRARQMGFPVLELETRIELTDNHKIFNKLGFETVGEGSHSGLNGKPILLCGKEFRVKSSRFKATNSGFKVENRRSS